ncbi:MAG: hypothetical protein FWD70_07355 [Desulfuromonadales bacterium]|nr:hypothetical protein [Desulfuromonadales bacterium]
MRTTTSIDIRTVLASDNCPLLVLAQLDFKSATLRVCNAGYSFTWDGYEWLGLGELGGISGVTEGGDLQMYGCTLQLTGIDPNYVYLALDPTEFQGRDATIWLAPLDKDYKILNNPVIVFKGRMDVMPIEMGDTATIQLTIESKLIDWERPRMRRYNHEDQISQYPNDLGLQFIPQMVEKELYWGRPS